MTMPPLADDPEASRPYFRRLRELAEEHGLRELSMGTSQDYRVAAEEGATLRPGRLRPLGDEPSTALTFRGAMGFADVWNRTLVYFGIAEEDDDWDEDGYATDEELERDATHDRPNVRRLAPRRAAATSTTTGPTPSPARRPRARASCAPARGAASALRGVQRRREAAPARTSRCTSSSRAASTTRSRSPTASRTASR